jgi:hypothetical protein
MNPSLFANAAVLLAVLFIVAAAFGETLATRQIAAERFRFVALVRLLRHAQWLAVGAGLAFIGSIAWAAPLLSFLGLAGGAVIALLMQARLLEGGATYQFSMRGLLPALVLGVVVANLPESPALADTALALDVLALCAAPVLAFGYWYVAHQRTQQDLMAVFD